MTLTENQIKTLHNNKFLATSDRYIPIKSIDVIQEFKNLGFSITDYRESNYRNLNKQNKVRHMIRMSIDADSGLRRDVVIFNSYDSSTSLRLNFGAYRGVCQNTLVFGDVLLPEERIKHTSLNPLERVREYGEQLKEVLEKEAILRNKMEVKRLSRYDLFLLAEKAISIREQNIDEVLDVNELNIAKRFEDKNNDVWTSFNRVQESLINGNYKKQGIYMDEYGKPQPVFKKAKIITDPSELIRINKSVHSLYAEMVL
jgi:hypothetical protein